MKYYLLLMFFSYSVLAADDLEAKLKTHIQVGAHRGGGLSPEKNTLPQFQKALAEGADIVEMDLRLSSDGVVMVFHDESMQKSTNCRGPLAGYSSTELKNCRFKTNSNSIPTFEEVLQWSVGRVVVSAEFKAQATIKPGLKLIEKYQANVICTPLKGQVKKAGL